jgi:hypothetical protein
MDPTLLIPAQCNILVYVKAHILSGFGRVNDGRSGLAQCAQHGRKVGIDGLSMHISPVHRDPDNQHNVTGRCG